MNTLNSPQNLDTTQSNEGLRKDLNILKQALQVQIQKEDTNKNPQSRDFLKHSLDQLNDLETDLLTKSSETKQSEHVEDIQNKLNSLKQLHASFNTNGGNIEQVYKQMADIKREQLQQEVSHTASQMGEDRPWLQGLVKRALNQ